MEKKLKLVFWSNDDGRSLSLEFQGKIKKTVQVSCFNTITVNNIKTI